MPNLADQNRDLMRRMYAELAARLAVDLGSLERSGSHLLLNPVGGTVIDPTLDMAKREDRNTLRALTGSDLIFQESWISNPSPLEMPQVYQRILNGIITPSYSRTPAEEEEYNRIDRLLFEPDRSETELLLNYYDAQDALEEAIIRIENKRNNNQQPTRRDYRDLERARDRYEVQAQGITVSRYLQRHRELQRQAGTAWVDDDREMFNQHEDDTSFYPTYPQWVASPGDPSERRWTRITVTSSELESRQTDERTSFAGGALAEFGIFRVGGTTQWSNERRHIQSETTGFSFSLDVLSVTIRRRWLDFGLFESRSWDWSRGSQYVGRLLSDGQFSPPSDEIWPLIPTRLLIARNVVVSANWSINIQDMINQQLQANAVIGIGPFCIGGRYERSTSEEYNGSSVANQEISFEPPQIIGYFAYEVPHSPNPDPNLPWSRSLRRDARALEALEGGPEDPLVGRAQQLLATEPPQ